MKKFKIERYEHSEERSYPRFENNEPVEYYNHVSWKYRIVFGKEIVEDCLSCEVSAKERIKNFYTIPGINNYHNNLTLVIKKEIKKLQKELLKIKSLKQQNKENLKSWFK